MMRFFAVAVAAEAVTFAPASTTQRYAALDAAFWRDVDTQVGPDPPPRFAQFCRQFRDTWNDDVAEMGPESTELDDDKARPLLVGDQYVARHGGLFPGLRTTPWWDPSEFAWLTPLVEAAPDIAKELASARGIDEIVKEGVEVEVKFPGDAGRYAATILRQVEDDAFLVSYEDGEEETVQRSCIYGKATPWLRRVRARGAPPPLLEACGFEHVSVATALSMAEPARFARTRAAWRAALDAGLFDVMQWQRRVYGSPRLVGLSRQRPRSVLPAHSDLRNWVLTAHVPLTTPAAPRPGPRAPPPSLDAQKALAPRRALARAATRDADRAAYAAKLWGAGERAGGGGAGMIVAGEARPWTEPLVFDTSFVHSAYNDGDAPADYLHVDFFHPDLTAAERRALRVLRDGQARWRAARAALRAELMR